MRPDESETFSLNVLAALSRIVSPAVEAATALPTVSQGEPMAPVPVVSLPIGLPSAALADT